MDSLLDIVNLRDLREILDDLTMLFVLWRLYLVDLAEEHLTAIVRSKPQVRVDRDLPSVFTICFVGVGERVVLVAALAIVVTLLAV